jgi:hypothetical protein
LEVPQNFGFAHHRCSAKNVEEVLDGAKLKNDKIMPISWLLSEFFSWSQDEYEQDYAAAPDMMVMVNQNTCK